MPTALVSLLTCYFLRHLDTSPPTLYPAKSLHPSSLPLPLQNIASPATVAHFRGLTCLLEWKHNKIENWQVPFSVLSPGLWLGPIGNTQGISRIFTERMRCSHSISASAIMVFSPNQCYSHYLPHWAFRSSREASITSLEQLMSSPYIFDVWKMNGQMDLWSYASAPWSPQLDR